jgi:hypothetical protein
MTPDGRIFSTDYTTWVEKWTPTEVVAAEIVYGVTDAVSPFIGEADTARNRAHVLSLGSLFLDDLYAKGVLPAQARCTGFAPAASGTLTITMSPWLEAALERAGCKRIP